MKIEQVSEHIWSLQAWLMIPVRVWVVVDEEGVTLVDAGMPFMAKGTPGHSPGHVVYFHEQDQVLLAGDLFTSRRGKLRPPMSLFTGDMAAAIRSAGIVKKLNPRRLEVCHGGPVFAPADQLDAYLHRHASQAQGGVDR